MEKKFNKSQRDEVVCFAKEYFDVSLSKIDGHVAYYHSNKQKNFYIMGSSCNWHGIKRHIIDHDMSSIILVIAIANKGHIKIFCGKMDSLRSNSKLLHKAGEDQYHFNTKERDNRLYVKELPGVSLEKIGEISNGVSVEVEKQQTNPVLLDLLRTNKSKNIIRKSPKGYSG